LTDPTTISTHQCDPSCRHCFGLIEDKGEHNNGISYGCTRKKCIRRHEDISCPRCPSTVPLHDAVACPRIQFTKSIEIDEFLASAKSSKFPPLPAPKRRNSLY